MRLLIFIIIDTIHLGNPKPTRKIPTKKINSLHNAYLDTKPRVIISRKILSGNFSMLKMPNPAVYLPGTRIPYTVVRRKRKTKQKAPRTAVLIVIIINVQRRKKDQHNR